jgi:hypothetical protein
LRQIPEPERDLVNPVLHYVRDGERRGLKPTLQFDPLWYRDRYEISDNDCALRHYLQHVDTREYSPIQDFETAFRFDRNSRLQKSFYLTKLKPWFDWVRSQLSRREDFAIRLRGKVSKGLVSGHRRRAILVLGMHRSGTSALTRLLNLLGAALPSTLLQPNEYNEAGYWESLPINRVLERLLLEAGSAWQDWRAFDPSWYQTPSAASRILEVKQAISAEFGHQPFFVLKDPRICRLVPLFRDVLRELDIDPCAVIIFRHPAEVAASLKRRDQLLTRHARLLWLRHVIEAERNTRSWRRAFISYSRLVRDSSAVVFDLANRLGLNRYSDVDAVASQANAEVNESYRHHVADSMNASLADAPWLERVYSILNEYSLPGTDGMYTAELDQVYGALEEHCETSRHAESKQMRPLRGTSDQPATVFQSGVGEETR